ncbi:MAG: DMT family transporter [Pseudobacteriovorax sp.]|nr:DMT family transporter [Pseudobacteriovorax sp.]
MESIPLIGELASLGAALIWAVSLTLFSRFGSVLNPTALNLWKNSIALVCFAALILFIKPEWPDGWEVYVAFGLSGILGLAVGDTALFAALQRLGAQNTSVSQCCVPLITGGLAYIFLSESLSAGEVLGMIITGLAIFLVIRHDNNRRKQSKIELDLFGGLFFAAIAALCQAGAVVIIRHYLQGVDVALGTAIRLLPAFCVLFLVGAFRGDVAKIIEGLNTRSYDFLILSVAALFGTFLGLLMMSTGAKYAKAGISAALTATYPLWIIPLSVWIAKESVSIKKSLYTVIAVVGVGIMMAAG